MNGVKKRLYKKPHPDLSLKLNLLHRVLILTIPMPAFYDRVRFPFSGRTSAGEWFRLGGERRRRTRRHFTIFLRAPPLDAVITSFPIIYSINGPEE